MKRSCVLALILALPALTGSAAGSDPPPRDRWPQWRGALGTGAAPLSNPPVTWSEERNVRWKTGIPGLGHSTPVIWGERIFLTTAVAEGEVVQTRNPHSAGAHDNVPPSRRQQLTVLAVNRRDGAILWQRTVATILPHESMHATASWASASPVTDGRHVIASFGSGGLYGLDVDGKVLWTVAPGKMVIKHGHGEGSSPALHGDTVIVNHDHEGDSFLLALDKRTGKELWKVAREEGTSWSTPLVVEHDGKPQVIVSATRRVRAYDLSNGKVIWECAGLSDNVIATPVASDGLVFVASSYETRAMMAIRLEGARGDITGTDKVVWTRDRDTPYVPSLLLYNDALCFLKHYQGLFTCVDAKSGNLLFGPERLPGLGNVYASPVGAGGRVYIMDLEGAGAVLRQGPRLEVLALNRLEDSFSASPAVVGDELYIRGKQNLYCIAADPDRAR